MRSYGQYCAVAKALDLLGERWTLLIVRELLMRGPSRYTDVRNGLPGIATNLLAARFRELEQAGVVAREDAPPPVATTLFRLTPRGEQLAPVLCELGRWGAPFMREQAPGDQFRSHWLWLPARLYLTDREPGQPPATIEVRAGGPPVFIEAGGGSVRLRAQAGPPDVILTGEPPLVLALLSGHLAVGEAAGRGLRIEGDRQALCRVLPAGPFPA